MAATACEAGHLELIDDEGLRWYRSSPAAERGFCKHCGSNLFWRPDQGAHISIMSGTLDVPTGLTACEHIHVDSAADYYTIDDGLPRFAGDPAMEKVT